MRHIAALLMAHLIALVANGSVPEAVQLGAAEARWEWASFACEFECSRRVLPEHHEVADVFAAMIKGDAALMLLDAQAPIDDLSSEQLLTLHVAFAAQDAELRRVAWAVNHHLLGRRFRFTPKDDDDRVTLRLDRVELGELVKVLSGYGKVKSIPPTAR